MRIIIFTVLILISGCVSNSISNQQIINAEKTKSEAAFNGKHKYRLSYRVAGKEYSYSTYEIEGSYKYIQILIEGGIIVSVSQIQEDHYYRPEIEKCTLFPYHANLNVNECFLNFNKKILNMNNPALGVELSSVDISAQERQKNAVIGTLVTATVLSPLLIPAAIVSSPIAIYDYTSSESQKKSFKLALGRNENLPSYLSSIEAKFISKENGSGTAYLESGILSEPAMAFGFIQDEIIWIQDNPFWVCGGGFMFWGLKCTVGRHEDKHW